jgi:two-component system, chemotaxis family, chemotaxis protein CheY
MNTKILIVEDDPITRKVLAKLLSQHGECTVASSGEEGFDRFTEALECAQPFSLISLDYMMPKMDGRTLLKKIRAVEKQRHEDPSKVIMTTSVNDAPEVVRAFRYGCSAYITKPIQAEILFGELKNLGIG